MVKTLPFPEFLRALQLPALNRNLFSSPEWMTVLARTYGTRIEVKYIERDGRVDAWVFYAVVKNFLEWKICVCSYCDYCDGFVSRPEDWQLFLEAFRKEFPQYRIAVRNLRDPLVRENPAFKVLSEEYFHLLDVRDDLDTLWQRTHDSFQRGVRKAEKHNLTVRVAEKARLKDFFQMHLRLRKFKYRLFAQPYRFLEIIWEEYMEKNQGFLLGAFDQQDRMIAANVYLICGNTLYYKFNTSRLNALIDRPNNLLLWEGIKLAKKNQLEFLDLGSSGLDQEGLVRFKDHSGAQRMKITHLGFAPPGYKFSQKRILRTFTNFCTLPWLPDGVSQWGSDIIYPYLA